MRRLTSFPSDAGRLLFGTAVASHLNLTGLFPFNVLLRLPRAQLASAFSKDRSDIGREPPWSTRVRASKRPASFVRQVYCRRDGTVLGSLSIEEALRAMSLSFPSRLSVRFCDARGSRRSFAVPRVRKKCACWIWLASASRSTLQRFTMSL